MLRFTRLTTAFIVCAAMAASGAFAQHGGGGHGGGGHGGGGGHSGGGGGGHMGGGGFSGGGGGGRIGGGSFGGGGGHIGGGSFGGSHTSGGGMSSGHFSGGGMSSGHVGGGGMSSGRSAGVPRSQGGGMSVPRSSSSFGSPSSRGGMSIPRTSGSPGSHGQSSMQFNNGLSGSSRGHVGGFPQNNSGLNLGQRHVGSPDMTAHSGGHQPGNSQFGPSNHQPGVNGPQHTAMSDGGLHQGGHGNPYTGNGNPNNGNWNGNHNNGNWNGNHNNGGHWDGDDGGWNGHYHNHYNSWHHGFWPLGFWGFSPWWGGYGLGYGLGYGYGGWGYGYNSWGYGWGYPPLCYNSGYYPYYNPYCTGPLILGSTVIDYSQPVTVADQASPDDATTAAAMAEFDNARAAFKYGDYDAAISGVNRALELIPDDGVLHEFRALVLFAQGNYQEAAATIHSVLAGGPGWDWPTLRSLYSDVNTYTVQLRSLEAYAREHPSSSDARFLLAYHYLSCGYADAGLEQLRRVVALEPNDTVAQELIRSMSPGEESPTPAPSSSLLPELPPAAAPRATDESGLPPAPPQAVRTGGQPAAAETLTGAWSATREDGSSFSLSLNKDGSFRWDYTGNGEVNSLSGKYSLANDLLVLEPESGGAMVGRVSESADGQFHFQLLGGPPGDTGLTFKK